MNRQAIRSMIFIPGGEPRFLARPRLGKTCSAFGQTVPRFGKTVPKVGKGCPRVGKAFPGREQACPSLGKTFPNVGRAVPSLRQAFPKAIPTSPKRGEVVLRFPEARARFGETGPSRRGNFPNLVNGSHGLPHSRLSPPGSLPLAGRTKKNAPEVIGGGTP